MLPAADEPVRYEKHIRQLLRERDRRSMSFAFGLWSYDEVHQHADEILERVRNCSDALRWRLAAGLDRHLRALVQTGASA